MRQGPFDRTSAELLELLLPHVQSALRTRRMLAAAAGRAARAEAALDAVVTPTFLLNAQNRVVYRNCAGEALLAAADGLEIRGQRLVAGDRRSNEALQSAIHAATMAGSALPSRPLGAVALIRPSGKQCLRAIVSPLRVASELLPWVQLKAILHKTGVGRQSELLRLLMSLPRRYSGATAAAARRRHPDEW